MKAKRSKNKYIILGIAIIIGVTVFGLKNYSDVLRKDGQRELYETKNRKVAIEKIKLAQVVWPFLKSDKPYQNLLGELQQIEPRSAVNIFLTEDASAQDIKSFVAQLQAINGVKEVKFISQEEALKRYKESNKNDSLLMVLVVPNILPQSIEVYLDDFTVRNQVGELAKNKPFVTKVVQSL